MRAPNYDIRHARAARRRPGERGMTMIELLLSLAILAVMTGFLVEGLSMGRRAFDADRMNEIASETDAAIEVVAGLIGSALPAQGDKGGQVASVAFDGRQEGISFVGLSEGRSLRGGPHKFDLRRVGGDLVVGVTNASADTRKEVAEPSPPEIVVLHGVRDVHFGYFGRTKASSASVWRDDWFGQEHLPDLVSIRIGFADERRNEPAVIVALRQR